MRAFQHHPHVRRMAEGLGLVGVIVLVAASLPIFALAIFVGRGAGLVMAAALLVAGLVFYAANPRFKTWIDGLGEPAGAE